MTVTTRVDYFSDPIPVDLEKEKSDKKQITYYYPTIEQSSLNNVCRKIISVMEQKNWASPGIKIEFSDTVEGPITYRIIEFIEGQDFRIYFCRKQDFRQQNQYSVDASVEIDIPLKKLWLDSVESDLKFYVYVGKKWKVDRNQFVYGTNIYAKLYREPRTYIIYQPCSIRGIDDLNPLYSPPKGIQNPDLVADDSYDLEYSPEEDEPTRYAAKDVFKEFVSYLKNTVLEDLEKKSYTIKYFFDFNFFYKK